MNNGTTRPFAVVTGASRGIGYELAKQFAEHGFDLFIAADSDLINEAGTKLQTFGVDVQSLQVDLAKYEGVEQLWKNVQAQGRPVEAIAINAGVGAGGEFATNDLKAELNMISLNVMSTVHLAKRVVNDMLSRGGGKILFTSSIASRLPEPYNAVYAATKAFIQSFSQGIRAELKDSGVSVTALMPGPTETNFFHRANMDDTKIGAGEKDDPAEVARQGYEALMAGKDHVIAGSFTNKLTAGLAASVLPETVTAAAHIPQTKPGSAKAKTS